METRHPKRKRSIPQTYLATKWHPTIVPVEGAAKQEEPAHSLTEPTVRPMLVEGEEKSATVAAPSTAWLAWRPPRNL